MIDVGERLKELMEARGLNMHSLAKRSGLSWNTIKNFYSRKSIPTVTTISMLCDGLGITLAQFFDVTLLTVVRDLRRMGIGIYFEEQSMCI